MRFHLPAKKPFLVAILVMGLVHCKNSDRDFLFTPTQQAIIAELSNFPDLPDDVTNSYDTNSAAATLGQKFFFDKRFSGEIVAAIPGGVTGVAQYDEGKISCASCHDPSYGFADGSSIPNMSSFGAKWSGRNAPTVLNTSLNPNFFSWAGQRDSAWAMVSAPIESGAVHNYGRLSVANRICAIAGYKSEYEAIFGTITVCAAVTTAIGSCSTTAGSREYGKPGQSCYDSMSAADKTSVTRIYVNFMKSIAAYERLLVSKNSAFDRWASGDDSAMSAKAVRGLKLFLEQGNCIRCHNGPNFTDYKFHNLGVAQTNPYGSSNDKGRYDGISTVLSQEFNVNSVYSDSTSTGKLNGLSASSSDVGAFKTPTLRSVNLTPPYMHTGTLPGLWDVVRFYSFGGDGSNVPGSVDPIFTPRHLSDDEILELVSFLESLEGESLPTNLTTSPTLP